MADDFDPLVPRPMDRPTAVPLTPGADLIALDHAKIMAAPDDPASWPAWRAQLDRWRVEARERHRLDDAIYRQPDLAWTSSCFVVAQVWLWDELPYDEAAQAFTPERFVADARERFGGSDGVVLWHAYPVIGIDDRNQWDFYRDVDGLTDLVARLHGLGVRVFVDYNPWDPGTRRSGNDADELASLVRGLGVDGVFLDTLKEGGGHLLNRLAQAGNGIAVEGEATLPIPRLADHPLSWAQWFADSPVPGVVRSHLLEPRHQMHHVRRWHRDHSEELQSAWLNGIGVMVWEVVFGAWVGWSERDAQTVRRMTGVQRGLHEILREGSWTPLVDLGEAAAADQVFGTRFDGDQGSLLALVNRGDRDTEVAVAVPGGRAYDVWVGAMTPVTEARVHVVVPARGIGGVWVTTSTEAPDWLREGRPLPASPAFEHRVARRTHPGRSAESADHEPRPPAGRTDRAHGALPLPRDGDVRGCSLRRRVEAVAPAPPRPAHARAPRRLF